MKNQLPWTGRILLPDSGREPFFNLTTISAYHPPPIKEWEYTILFSWYRQLLPLVAPTEKMASETRMPTAAVMGKVEGSSRTVWGWSEKVWRSERITLHWRKEWAGRETGWELQSHGEGSAQQLIEAHSSPSSYVCRVTKPAVSSRWDLGVQGSWKTVWLRYWYFPQNWRRALWFTETYRVRISKGKQGDN